jgi:quaternary ammonium compound-resistance protein SugE
VVIRARSSWVVTLQNYPEEAPDASSGKPGGSHRQQFARFAGRMDPAFVSRRRMRVAWVALFLAGVFAIVGALIMKTSDGLRRPVPTVLTLAAMAVSVVLLAQAMRTLPVSTAYAVWTGIGAAGAAIFGILIFGEEANLMKLLSAGLIVAGVIGLRLFGSGQAGH